MKRKITSVITVVVASALMLLGLQAPAQATSYWGCPSGVGCVWVHSDGGGSRLTLPVGTYGVNKCWNMAASWNDVVSSASADYGSGYDLVLYPNSSCGSSELNPSFYVESSRSVSFTGLRSWFNDETSSFAIVCC